MVSSAVESKINKMAARKKTIKKVKSNVEPEDTLSKAEQVDVTQLIAQALTRYKNEQFKDKKLKIKEISHLALMCEEYLSSFALIGFSLEGEKFVVFNTPTPRDESALVDLLRATFIDIANNRP